jgi:hypothetical protein
MLVKSLFSSCRKFQNGRKNSDNCCVKLNEIATETFEMLKNA